MDRPAFDELLRTLQSALSLNELAQLGDAVHDLHQAATCIMLIEQAAQGRGCPRCGGSRIHRCGQASGLQRFRCLGCRRSYNALTGTPLARMRKKGRWLTYQQCVLDSCTVRKAAALTQVHRTTSFRWRHRFVPGAARTRDETLGPVVEVDETYLLESQKGSRTMTRAPRRRGGVSSKCGINHEHDCLLVARDRTGRTRDFHTGRGPVTAAQLGRHLADVLPADMLLISDGALAYRRFAATMQIAHAWINASAGEHVRGDIHIQNVNGWHARFKGWLVRFRGVASRYLQHYSGWQRFLDAHELITPAQLLVASAQRS